MQNTTSDSKRNISPAELRAMFGENLKLLCTRAASVSALCRELGINRTQFNRYLSGESFPRPDVLHKICTYFNVDARILLEPARDIIARKPDLMLHPELQDFISASNVEIPEDKLPSGFYRFSRPSFSNNEQFLQGLVYIYRSDNYTFIRGHEAKNALEQQGLSTSPGTREFRGFLMAQDGGVAGFMSRRGARTSSFTFLTRVPSFENNFWVGYVSRTVGESISAKLVTRIVFEHLGKDVREIMSTARAAGLCKRSDLVPYHQTLLRPDEPFQ